MTAPEENQNPQKQRNYRRHFTRRPRQQQGNDQKNDSGERREGGQVRRESFHRNKQQKFQPKNKQPQQQAQPQGRAFVPVGEPESITGLLEITNKGFGFIRTADNDWAPSDTAIYVPADIITELRLRPFVQLTGMAQKYERGHQLISVQKVNGMEPAEAAACPHFEDLKAVNPTHRLSFETTPSRFTTRTLDLMAPVARGQRGLIVAPPRTGKTTLLMHIAEGAMENYGEDLHLMVLLVDERPEEVTEFKRALPGAEIFASSNDSGVREHCRMAEMAIERAKRLVEAGRHVLILLDSITRLARAYNTLQPHSGKILSGGVDANALHKPKRFFGAARNIENHGSLTIIATALIDTGSKMDEVIFEEFKGTGNMELHLDRRLVDKRVYPAINIEASGTRKEELLLHPQELQKIWILRKAMNGAPPVEAMELMVAKLKKIKTNIEFLMTLQS